jgi:hypothetical protein
MPAHCAKCIGIAANIPSAERDIYSISQLRDKQKLLNARNCAANMQTSPANFKNVPDMGL